MAPASRDKWKMHTATHGGDGATRSNEWCSAVAQNLLQSDCVTRLTLCDESALTGRDSVAFVAACSAKQMVECALALSLRRGRLLFTRRERSTETATDGSLRIDNSWS